MSKFKIPAKAATKSSSNNPPPSSVAEFAAGAAMVQSQSSERPPKPVRLNLDLDPDTHDRLKRRALDQKKTVAGLVRQLIDSELSK